MKKLFVLALLVVGLTTYAQKKGGDKKEITPEQRTEMQVKRMTKELDLNEKQQKEVKELLESQKEGRTEFAEKRKEMKESGEKPTQEQREEMKAKMIKNREAMKSKMKAILLTINIKNGKRKWMTEKRKWVNEKKKSKKKEPQNQNSLNKKCSYYFDFQKK